MHPCIDSIETIETNPKERKYYRYKILTSSESTWGCLNLTNTSDILICEWSRLPDFKYFILSVPYADNSNL
jgi:hypothetical protein